MNLQLPSSPYYLKLSVDEMNQLKHMLPLHAIYSPQMQYLELYGIFSWQRANKELFQPLEQLKRPEKLEENDNEIRPQMIES